MRSAANFDLGDGVRVRRTALFYSPRFNGDSEAPIPPLPTERGAALREHGCRLGKIVAAFDGVADPRQFAGQIAKQLPGHMQDGFGTEDGRRQYWQAIAASSVGAEVSIHPSEAGVKPAAAGPTVLLEERTSDRYLPPSRDTIQASAGQPWLALRAAKLAQMPLAETLDMLNLAAPTTGDQREQPPIYCERGLVPVLRRWLGEAEKLPAERHAAALLVADQVADEISGCTELLESASNSAYPSDKAFEEAREALLSDMAAMGIDVAMTTHPPSTDYSGNLLEEAHRLSATAGVDELYRAARLGMGCIWSGYGGNDCAEPIREQEDFLRRYPQSPWTPSVRLMLTESYEIALTSGDADLAPEARAAMLQQTEGLYRAWFASGQSARDRVLVWGEIWRLDAGLGPWLQVPDQLR